MVSTRRNSGSLSAANSSKRPSSSEDKPPSPSPKRQKVPISNAYSFSFSLFLASLSDSFRFFFQADNGAVASEKPMPPAENSKELRTPEPPADPGECGHADAQITGTAAADDKADATPPIADGTSLPLTLFNLPFTYFDYLFYLFIITAKVLLLLRIWWLISLGPLSLRGAYIRSKTRTLSLQLHGADSCPSVHR